MVIRLALHCSADELLARAACVLFFLSWYLPVLLEHRLVAV